MGRSRVSLCRVTGLMSAQTHFSNVAVHLIYNLLVIDTDSQCWQNKNVLQAISFMKILGRITVKMRKSLFSHLCFCLFFIILDKNKIFTFRKQNLAKERKHLDFQELRYLIDCLIL